MADTILSGDIQVNYSDDNRWKSLNWIGGASTTYTMNQIYSALQDLFDETGQMDDGTVMSAETPTEYTIGIIDSGDTDPWYVTYDLMEHVAGDTTLGQRAGALRTSSWARVEGTNTGIVVVQVATGGTIVTGDIGLDISHGTDSDAGTLLDVISPSGASNDYLVIRPDSSASANSFDSTSGTLNCNGHSATQTAASTTGEQIWANFFTIGTIEEDTHIYFYQGLTSDASRARVHAVGDLTQDWWGDGHIDLCIFTRDYTINGPSNTIDGGYVKAFARKATTQYSTFEASSSTTSGGSNPVPINTAADLDNTTGYKSITTTAVAVDTFSVGDEIAGGTSGARAIITSITGSSPTYTFHYYLLDDPQTDFQTAAETITNEETGNTGSATKDGNAPANQGPRNSTWFTSASGTAAPTISVTHTTADIDDDGTNENYGIVIDCNNNTLSYVYEWLKYITRNGATTTDLVTDTYSTDYTDGIEGEQYVGAEAYLAWSGNVTGTIAEGGNVTQAGSGATGTIISYNDTGGSGGYMLLRDVRGTFNTSGVVTDNDNSGTVTPNSVATNFAPNTQSPFGSFPGGGTFFGARGVLLTDYNSSDENNFSLVDVAGTTKARPQAYSITVTNLVGTDESTTTDDRVTVFRLTGSGGSINKTEYSATGGEAIGASSLVVDSAITTDTPGKTTGGVLRIRDVSNSYQNYRIRFSSWATSTFTLANVVPSNLTTGTNTTTIVSTTDELDNLKRGDLVLNVTQSNAISYVTSVTAASNTVTISPAITGQSSTDTIEFNAIPVAIAAGDDVYVPLIDQYATSTSASVSIIYVSQIFYRARVRNVANSTPIKPFEVDSSLNGANSSVQTVRTTDTIYT